MATLPGGVLWNPRWTALDSDGAIVPNALLEAYETGGAFSIPQPLYSDVDLSIELTNPVEADSSGRFPEMFMLPVGYDLRLTDEDGVTIWTAIDVEDIGQAFLSNLGTLLQDGSRDVEDGYTVTSDDNFLTVDTSGGDVDVLLQAASDRTMPLGIKNISDAGGVVNVTPDGSETIDEVAAVFVIPAAASPTFPTIWLFPTTGGYYIASSHGL